MRLDLNNLNPGLWFDLIDGKPKQGRICIRKLSFDELERIDKATIKEVRRDGQTTREIDEPLRTKMTWSYCIVGWDEEIRDADGTSIPCNDDTKYQLMQESPMFANLVNKRLNAVLSEQEARAAEELPN